MLRTALLYSSFSAFCSVNIVLAPQWSLKWSRTVTGSEVPISDPYIYPTTLNQLETYYEGQLFQ